MKTKRDNKGNRHKATGICMAALLLCCVISSCSSPIAPPDPFDQALGSIMSMRAAAFQSQSMERSAR